MKRFYRIFNHNFNYYDNIPVSKMFDKNHWNTSKGKSIFPYELEEYIGMEDVDGIKIFENDLIIKASQPELSYLVEIDKRFLRAVAKRYNSNHVVIGYLDMSTIRAGLIENDLKIIGNIHDTFKFQK